MNDFEKALVFVRCLHSILAPDFLLPCYDMDGGIEPSNTHICYSSCPDSMVCQYVYLILWLLWFHLCLCFFFVFLSFACFARALACLIVCECMRACLRALSDRGLWL